MKKLLAMDLHTEDQFFDAMTKEKSQLEELFAKGLYKAKQVKQFQIPPKLSPSTSLIEEPSV